MLTPMHTPLYEPPYCSQRCDLPPPLLRRLPNAHIELSRYEKLGGVEELRDEFGAERLLYGSYYPRYAMGPILYYLHTADFSSDELAAVCAGNL